MTVNYFVRKLKVRNNRFTEDLKENSEAGTIKKILFKFRPLKDFSLEFTAASTLYHTDNNMSNFRSRTKRNERKFVTEKGSKNVGWDK